MPRGVSVALVLIDEVSLSRLCQTRIGSPRLGSLANDLEVEIVSAKLLASVGRQVQYTKFKRAEARVWAEVVSARISPHQATRETGRFGMGQAQFSLGLGSRMQKSTDKSGAEGAQTWISFWIQIKYHVVRLDSFSCWQDWRINLTFVKVDGCRRAKNNWARAFRQKSTLNQPYTRRH